MANPLATKRDYWIYFAGEAGRGGDCPLYERISTAIADDPALQALAASAQPGQPPANMLFAAVHFLLLGGAEHPLRRYYPHLLAEGETEDSPDDRAPGHFADFVHAHADAIRALLAARVTNTNEVRRSTYLYAGLGVIAAREPGRDLALIEIGPSAGLNLRLDRNWYRFVKTNGWTREGGNKGSALELETEVRAGDPPVPPMPPRIGARIGLEMNPVDLGREEDRRWLLALLWPGPHGAARIARMKAALAICAEDPAPIRAGDGIALLPAAIGEIPEGMVPVVVHTMVSYQLGAEGRAALETALEIAGTQRPLWRLFQDRVREDDDPKRNPLRLWRYDGATRGETLAEVHPHGAWIEWHAPPVVPSAA